LHNKNTLYIATGYAAYQKLNSYQKTAPCASVFFEIAVRFIIMKPSKQNILYIATGYATNQNLNS